MRAEKAGSQILARPSVDDSRMRCRRCGTQGHRKRDCQQGQGAQQHSSQRAPHATPFRSGDIRHVSNNGGQTRPGDAYRLPAHPTARAAGIQCMIGGTDPSVPTRSGAFIAPLVAQGAIARNSQSQDAVADAIQRRVFVPVMAGDLVAQRQVLACLDNGADYSCIAWDTLTYVMGKTREELLPTLEPASFSSIKGAHPDDGQLPIVGSIRMEVELIYTRRDLSLRCPPATIQGRQMLRLQVVGGGCSHNHIGPGPTFAIFIVGSNDLIGSPDSILCQVMAEIHRPSRFQLGATLSRMVHDGYISGLPARGTAAEVAFVPMVSTGDSGDAVGVKVDSRWQGVHIAAMQGRNETTPLWTAASVDTVAQRAQLSLQARNELARIVFNEQPSRAFVAAITRLASKMKDADERGLGVSDTVVSPAPPRPAIQPIDDGPVASASTSFVQKFNWLALAVASQSRFSLADRNALCLDESVYVHKMDGVDVMFRSGAVVIPSSQRQLIEQIMHRAHYRVTCHAASGAMMQLLSYVYWEGMHADVKQFVRSCVPCQLAKTPRVLPPSSYLLRMAMRPFAEMQMDCLVCPGRIRVESGFAALFIVVDDFSGWIVVEPVVDQTAETLTMALKRRVFTDMPIPGVMR